MEDSRFTFEDCCWVGDDLFFFTKEMNLLCRYNRNDEMIKICGSIPEENFLAKRLVSAIMYADGEIILSPNMAKDIWIFKIKDNTWQKVVRNVRGNIAGRNSMYQMTKYKNKIYFIGSYYPAVVIMDLKAKTLEYADGVFTYLRDKNTFPKECFFFSNFVQKDECLYLASCRSNQIIKFNMELYTFEQYVVGNDEYRFSGILWNDKMFVILPRFSCFPILYWDGKNIIKEIPIDTNMTGMVSLKPSSYIDGKLYIPTLPEKSGMVIDDDIVKQDYKPLLFVKKDESGNVVCIDLNKNLYIRNMDKPLKIELSKEEIDVYVIENGINININTTEVIQETGSFAFHTFMKLCVLQN